MEFLDKLGGRWNISLFHYRNHGADFGRVLAGFEVPDAEHGRSKRSSKAWATATSARRRTPRTRCSWELTTAAVESWKQEARRSGDSFGRILLLLSAPSSVAAIRGRCCGTPQSCCGPPARGPDCSSCTPPAPGEADLLALQHDQRQQQVEGQAGGEADERGLKRADPHRRAVEPGFGGGRDCSVMIVSWACHCSRNARRCSKNAAGGRDRRRSKPYSLRPSSLDLGLNQRLVLLDQRRDVFQSIHLPAMSLHVGEVPLRATPAPPAAASAAAWSRRSAPTSGSSVGPAA